MALSSVDEAFAEYENWLSNDMFSPDQIDKLRVFFEGILERGGEFQYWIYGKKELKVK